MRHQLYKESLLEKLRKWRLSHPDGLMSQARDTLRKQLSTEDIDLLFDNWLNSNFDRVVITELKKGSVVAVIRKRYEVDPDRREREGIIANRLATKVKSNYYEEFAARIWTTVLPNGVVLRDATGKDMKHTSGWFAELGKRMKPTERVAKKFTTKELFNLAQREAFA